MPLFSSDWLERSSIVSFISWLRRQRTPNPREITRMIARETGKTILWKGHSKSDGGTQWPDIQIVFRRSKIAILIDCVGGIDYTVHGLWTRWKEQEDPMPWCPGMQNSRMPLTIYCRIWRLPTGAHRQTGKHIALDKVKWWFDSIIHDSCCFLFVVYGQ